MPLTGLSDDERGWLLLVLGEIAEVEPGRVKHLESLWRSFVELEAKGAYAATVNGHEIILEVPGEKPLTLMRAEELRAVCNRHGSYQRQRLERCLHLIFTPRRGR